MSRVVVKHTDPECLPEQRVFVYTRTMTNPDLFRQIVFQVVCYDTEFPVLGVVDMETSG